MKRRSNFQFPFEQYPAVRLAILLSVGILFSSVIESSVSVALILWVSAGLCYVLIERPSRRRISFRLTRLSIILYSLSLILVGFSFATLQNNTKENVVEELIQASPWEEITISGTVTDVSKNTSGKVRLTLNAKITEFEEGLMSEQKYKTRVLWSFSEEPELGDHLKFIGTVIPLSAPTNPGQFNYKLFLENKGVYSQIRPDSLILHSIPEDGISWVSIRKKARSMVERNFSKETAPIAKALLLGYKNELEGETRKAFARSGLFSYYGGFWFACWVGYSSVLDNYSILLDKKYGSVIGLVFLIVVLVFYGGVTGFSSPVIRASVMVVLLTYGKLFSKRSDSINLMGVAALILLLINPSQLFEIGFQLSFSAVAIILLVIPVIQSKIPYWIRTKWYGTPIMVIIISIVVQLGLYPLQAYYFGEVSIISPVANALFVPFLGIIVPISLVALLLAPILPELAIIINYPSLIFLEWMNAFVFWVSELSWAWVSVSKPTGLFFISWVFFTATIGSWRNPSIRWKWMSGSLMVLLLVQFLSLMSTFSSKKWK